MKQQLLLFFSLLFITLSFSQASLVKNINPGIASSSPNGLTVFNGNLYFSATTSAEGMELWKSDGTTSGTVLLKDINPGSSSSAPELLTPMVNGDFDELHFVADNGSLGRELWQSDGTISGTQLLQDIYVGPQSSNISQILDISSDFEYIVGDINTNTDYGIEIGWVTRLSGGSLILAKSINAGANDSNPENLFRYGNEAVYFSGEGQSIGKELYYLASLSQGTPVLVSDINPTGNSNPNYYITFNNKIYFSANNGTNGVELYEVDPNNSNTVSLIKDINTSGDSNPTEKIVFNGKIYFAADDGVNGVELWESDGTNGGTQMVLDLNSGSADSSPANFIIYNNRLYFTATNQSLGTEIFYLTAAGNIINAANINPGSANSNPSEFVEYNGKLYFVANDGVNGTELWETSGTALSTVMSADINSSGSSNPSGLTLLNNAIYFSAFGNSSPLGVELWKYVDPSLSIESLKIQKDILLTPNPTLNHFTLKNGMTISNVAVYDIQGKLVKSFKENTEQYDIEDLTSGLYFINIKTNKGQITKKLIKN